MWLFLERGQNTSKNNDQNPNERRRKKAIEPPNNKRKRKTHAMGAERVDREEGREEEEEEEEEEDMNELHRKAPESAPGPQPPVEREKDEDKNTTGYWKQAASMNARRLIDCLSEWSNVISSFIKRDLDITINDDGNSIHSSRNNNEIAQTTKATTTTTTTGPLREIERWKERNVERHKLFEQLNCKEMKKTEQSLEDSIHSEMIEDAEQHSKAHQTLIKFRYLRENLAALCAQSKENVKFLTTLEGHFVTISQGSFKRISRCLEPTLEALRLVWIISSHYSNDDRMGQLMGRIADELSLRVTSEIDPKLVLTVSRQDDNTNERAEGYADQVASLTKPTIITIKPSTSSYQPNEDVQDNNNLTLSEKLRDASLALRSWKTNYLKVRESIERSNRDARWEFDRERLFSRTDHIARVCDDLGEMLAASLDFQTFLSPKFRAVTLDQVGFDDAVRRVSNMNNRIIRCSFNAFDPSKAEDWADTVQVFHVDRVRIERVVRSFIDQSFKNSTSAKAAFELLHSFRTMFNILSLSPNSELLYDAGNVKHNRKNSSIRSSPVRDVLNKQMRDTTRDILDQFGREIDQIQHFFHTQERNVPLLRNQARISGKIAWSRQLFVSIRRTMRIFKFTSLGEDIQSAVALEIENKYLHFSKTVLEYEKELVRQWSSAVVDESIASLRSFILVKISRTEVLGVNDGLSHSSVPVFRPNFHENLSVLIREAKSISQLGHEIPSLAKDVVLQEDIYQSHLNSLKDVCSEYSRVTSGLTYQEFALFKGKLIKLEEALEPGCSKLNWNALGFNTFIQSSQHAIEAFERTVLEVRRISKSIAELTETISELRFFSPSCIQEVEGDIGLLPELDDVMSTLERTRDEIMERAVGKYKEVSNLLSDIEFCVIGTRSKKALEMQAFYEFSEKGVYCALVRAICSSLRSFRRDFISRCGVDNAAFFRCTIELYSQDAVISPSLEDISTRLNSFVDSIQNVGLKFTRWMHGTCLEVLQTQCVDVDEGSDTEYDGGRCLLDDGIRNDDILVTASCSVHETEADAFGITFARDLRTSTVCCKFAATAQRAIARLSRKIAKYVGSWGKFQHAMNTKARKQTLQMFTDLSGIEFAPLDELFILFNRYKCRVLTDSNRNVTISCAMIDATPLIKGVARECDIWIKELSSISAAQDSNFLSELNSKFRNIDGVADVVPSSLDEMKVFLRMVQDVRVDWETEINILKIKDRVKLRLGLRPEESFSSSSSLSTTHNDASCEYTNLVLETLANWKACKEKIERADADFRHVRMKFENQLRNDLNEFVSACEDTQADMQNYGPASDKSLVDLHVGVSKLNVFRSKIFDLCTRSEVLRDSEKAFQFPPRSVSCLEELQEDIEEYKSCYAVFERFDSKVKVHSGVLWESIDIEQLRVIGEESRRDCKSNIIETPKTSELIISIEKSITLFEETLDLFCTLKSPAMRPRHWEELARLAKTSIALTTVTFEDVLKLRLHEHAQHVREITNRAEREMKIEEDLIKLGAQWESAKFDLRPLARESREIHEKTLILCAVDDITLSLEDSSLTLQSISASKHAVPFRDTVQSLEYSLSHISDVLEAWIGTQRRWMYLQSIFCGADDIRAQLPFEADQFDQIDLSWREIMRSTQQEKESKVLESCKVEGRLHHLKELSSQLESCQKSLSQYLNTKRDAFPRFFFISDDELLSILGTSDPTLVQEHMLKLFDNCAKLIFGPNNESIVGLMSSEGESFELSESVQVLGLPVEVWMTKVENAMRTTLKEMCKKGIRRYANATSRTNWILEELGMVALVGSQIWWTWEVIDVFRRVKNGQDKMAMKLLSDKLTLQLADLTKLVRSDLTDLERKKVNTMIIIDVHARDIIESFVRDSILDESEFAWESQLRFKWDKKRDDIVINQCSGEFLYGYEYMGLNGRLVITGLTDRCYMTLTTALSYRLGGAPAGPAGTGKTETTKDLAKSMALLCVVFNCGEGLDYKAMGAIFTGLVQCGAWGCFDEFNRIDAEVLSVVSSQIRTIQESLKVNANRFNFEGKDIALDSRTGIFITMNPGYAGRTELPDNLKALFRPVQMIVPDLQKICEIMLFSEGFDSAKELAKKMTVLYKLAKEQLSKQSHYDFGLRALKSVLIMAGALKRESPELSEQLVLMRALRDMNLPKFVFEDAPLFLGLINDLFPGMYCPRVRYPNLNDAVEKDLESNGYQVLTGPSEQVDKVIQLYETMLTRHTTMIVGETGGGKSVIIKTLARAQDALGKPTKLIVLNPKAQSVSELYGSLDRDTREWTDGLLSNIFREANRPLPENRQSESRYIVFDGDVDAVWVENMNSVMDDNKLLTLPNGERIRLRDHCKLLFEVANLAHASPATVSRCGMVYVDPKTLGFQPICTSWIKKQSTEVLRSLFSRLFDKYVGALVEFCLEGVSDDEAPPTSSIQRTPSNYVEQLCSLLDSLFPLSSEDGGNNLANSSKERGSIGPDKRIGEFTRQIERMFIFAITWSFGATVVKSDRVKFDTFLRKLTDDPTCSCPLNLPSSGTMYDYGYDISSDTFFSWQSKAEKLPLDAHASSFSSQLIPTADTVRSSWLLKTLCSTSNKPILFVGACGTAKTVTIEKVLAEMTGSDSNMSYITMNLSSRTSSLDVQRAVEDCIEKRTKDVYGPPLGRKLIVFIDDLNMPKEDLYGTQQPVALLKILLERDGFYDRGKELNWKTIKDTQFICAMGHPGGARNTIDARFASLFNIFEIEAPSEENLETIYRTILGKLARELVANDDEVPRITTLVCEKILRATLELYHYMLDVLPPTPSKFHYIFNLRDLSRVFQGMSQSTANDIDSESAFVRLWRNEVLRVFHDRLVDANDRSLVKQKIESLVIDYFDFDEKISKHALLDPVLFADFRTELLVGGEAAEKEADEPEDKDECDEIVQESNNCTVQCDKKTVQSRYKDVGDYEDIKITFQKALDSCGDKSANKKMNLVFFHDALEHATRIHRVLRQERGHMLLIGDGGFGKQSLAKLAAAAAGCSIFEITLTRGYDENSFREDLKRLFNKVGVDNEKVVFLFTDNHVASESFLELINSILTSGAVPALYPEDEKQAIMRSVRDDALKENVRDFKEELWRFFISRARKNLHIVLCMSPTGDLLRSRCRNFPGLVNDTVIDWFTAWPEEALVSVATTFLSSIDEIPSYLRDPIANHVVSTHQLVMELSKKYKIELNRSNYVTPKNYLDYITNYSRTLGMNQKRIGELKARLEGGSSKLIQAGNEVDEMQKSLNQAKEVVEAETKACEELLKVITASTIDVKSKQEAASLKEIELKRENEMIAMRKKDAENDLAKAIPALEAAALALNSLKKEEITELKSFAKPNIAVQKVCECVMILKGLPNVSWSGAKAMMTDTNFLKSLIEFDKDAIKDKQAKELKTYTKDSKFTPEEVTKISSAGGGLLKWVFAMIKYNEVARTVNPKRAAVASAEKLLRTKTKELAKTKLEVEQLSVELASLTEQFQEKTSNQKKLKERAETMEARLSAAEKLLKGLESERLRWAKEMNELDESMTNLVGDCLLTSSFLSYSGAFTFEFRKKFTYDTLYEDLKARNIPVSQSFRLENLLTTDVQLGKWASEGLPTDDLSVQNGILTTKASRYPLCIDPQMQAVRWIKQREGKNLVGKIKTFSDADFLKQLELAVKYGLPFLFENVGEHLDPVIDNVLERRITERNGTKTVRIGDSDVEWDDNFRLYMTSKLPNPSYGPEVSGKTMIINYGVTLIGLQEQLLNVTVKMERPDLEMQRKSLVQETAVNKSLLKDLEDTLLLELSSASGEILDNVELIATLDETKYKAKEISCKLEEAKAASEKLVLARQAYEPIAKRGAILYFVLQNLNKVNSMYEYSLTSYLEVFKTSLAKTRQNNNSGLNASKEAGEDDDNKSFYDNITRFVNDLTFAVYEFASLGLFERDKLTLSMHMTLQILLGDGVVDIEQVNFFTKGGFKLDGNDDGDSSIMNGAMASMGEPFTKIISDFWPKSGLRDLEQLVTLESSGERIKSLIANISTKEDTWKKWLSNKTPEISAIPDDVQSQLTPFEFLCLLRCARVDRITAATMQFISSTLGEQYVTPPIVNYESMFNSTSAKTPVVFILSPGADPAFNVLKLGEKKGFHLGEKLEFMALGQGMGPRAAEIISSSAREGKWAMLQNCHLLPSWLGELEKILEDLDNPHEDFRLWLTTEPVAAFPLGVLQSSLKVVTEPPAGLQLNMKGSFAKLSEDSLNRCKHPAFRKLSYVLTFFHAIVQERRKYGKLGWNVPYDFNETDFRISLSLIETYLNKALIDDICDDSEDDRTDTAVSLSNMQKQKPKADIPWATLRYLIGEAMYGGRVSDFYDRRILVTYLNEYFGDFLFNEERPFAFHTVKSVLSSEYDDNSKSKNLSLSMEDASSADDENAGNFSLPQETSYEELLLAISHIPVVQTPEVLGLHMNADVAHYTRAAKLMWENLVVLQPKITSPALTPLNANDSVDGDHEDLTRNKMKRPEDMLDSIAVDILSVLPQKEDRNFEVKKLRKKWANTITPIRIALLQELEKHNKLTSVIKHTLLSLRKALNGEIAMSSVLDNVAMSLNSGFVPSSWKKEAPETGKNITSWIRWYRKRVSQFIDWVAKHDGNVPPCVWLSGLHSPETFIAALVQTSCRKKGWPLDVAHVKTQLTLVKDARAIMKPPENGCFVSGLYLEGARWDSESQALAKQKNNILVEELPVMHIIPVEKNESAKAGELRVPVYVTQGRRNAMGKGLVFEASLQSDVHESHWILQGVCMTLNLDD